MRNGDSRIVNSAVMPRLGAAEKCASWTSLCTKHWYNQQSLWRRIHSCYSALGCGQVFQPKVSKGSTVVNHHQPSSLTLFLPIVVTQITIQITMAQIINYRYSSSCWPGVVNDHYSPSLSAIAGGQTHWSTMSTGRPDYTRLGTTTGLWLNHVWGTDLACLPSCFYWDGGLETVSFAIWSTLHSFCRCFQPLESTPHIAYGICMLELLPVSLNSIRNIRFGGTASCIIAVLVVVTALELVQGTEEA